MALQGLQPAVRSVIITDPSASPEVTHGGPANPIHGQYEWADPFPYPWLAQPGFPTLDATASGELVGATPATPGAGTDLTLYSAPTETGSHAAPWPAFSVADSAVNDISALADRQAANALLHSIDSGDPAAFWMNPVPDDKMAWELSPDYVSPGQSILDPAVPEQLRGQMGRDRRQGFGPVNSYGYDSAHVTRYGPEATGDVPGNFLWLDGSQRPMRIEAAGRHTYPVGPGSYFEGQEPGVGSVTGAVLSGLPSAYQTPAVPPTADVSQYGSGAPVWGWG